MSLLALLVCLTMAGPGALAASPLDLGQVDARGFWVAETSGDPHRPVRLVYPDGGTGYDAGLLMDWASHPLMESQADGSKAPLVDTMASAHAFGGVAWKGVRFEAAAPMTFYGHDVAGGFVAAGDLRLGVLMPAIRPRKTRPGFGVQVSTWLPTGGAERWSGSPGTSVGMVATAAQEIGRAGWTANAGFRVSQAEELRNISAGPGPIGGVDVHYKLADQLGVGGGLTVQGATGFSSWPVELGVRSRYRTKAGSFGMIGLEKGFGDAVGTSAFRAWFGLGWGLAPPEKPPGPTVVPVVLNRSSTTPLELPTLVGDKIVIGDQVFFAEGRSALLRTAHGTLQGVVELMAAHPEIGHLLIEGHTNHNGGARYNRRLSETRAQVVVDWMVDRGVDRNRLLAKGFGEDRPLVQRGHGQAHSINRRVEFTVLRPDEGPGDLVLP
jgi:outer membrane protein OmpA-like peptidoglycan-associated protein